jgi:hypothetical protein
MLNSGKTIKLETVTHKVKRRAEGKLIKNHDRRMVLRNIPAFYGQFLRILILLVLFSAFFGTFNDRFIHLLSHQTIQELIEESSTFQYLFFTQFGAFLAVFTVLYLNKLQFIGWLRRENGRKLSGKASSYILSVSCILLLLPFIFLITL